MSNGKESFFRALDARQEQLKKADGSFWISPDLLTHVGFAIEPHSDPVLVPVHFFDSHLPPGRASRDLLLRAHSQTRSRHAQLGLFVASNAAEVIDQTLEVDTDGTVHAEIPLANVGNRTILVPENIGIGSLYLWNGKTVKNDNLKHLVKSGDIQMTGDEGKEWSFKHDERDNIIGIEYILNPDMRKYIPSTTEPIDLRNFNEPEYRQSIDELMVPIPKSARNINWIGETASVLTFSEKVNAIIDPKLNSPGYEAKHENSLLLRGGATNHWPIRVEISSPTTEELIPKSITFNFARAK